jgi:hypothetical protein
MNPWQLPFASDDDPEPTPADIARIESMVVAENAALLATGGLSRRCRCPRPAVDDDRCVWCGHEVERVIA